LFVYLFCKILLYCCKGSSVSFELSVFLGVYSFVMCVFVFLYLTQRLSLPLCPMIGGYIYGFLKIWNRKFLQDLRLNQCFETYFFHLHKIWNVIRSFCFILLLNKFLNLLLTIELFKMLGNTEQSNKWKLKWVFGFCAVLLWKSLRDQFLFRFDFSIQTVQSSPIQSIHSFCVPVALNQSIHLFIHLFLSNTKWHLNSPEEQLYNVHITCAIQLKKCLNNINKSN